MVIWLERAAAKKTHGWGALRKHVRHIGAHLSPIHELDLSRNTQLVQSALLPLGEGFGASEDDEKAASGAAVMRAAEAQLEPFLLLLFGGWFPSAPRNVRIKGMYTKV